MHTLGYVYKWPVNLTLRMDLKVICNKTHISIIKGCAGIKTNNAVTFQMFR